MDDLDSEFECERFELRRRDDYSGEFVLFRIPTGQIGTAQISLLKTRTGEFNSAEIALREGGLAEIGEGKVGIAEGAFLETHLTQIDSAPDRVIEIASGELCTREGDAIVKIDTEQFALDERGSEEIASGEASAGQITSFVAGCVESGVEEARVGHLAIEKSSAFQIESTEITFAKVEFAIRSA